MFATVSDRLTVISSNIGRVARRRLANATASPPTGVSVSASDASSSAGTTCDGAEIRS